MVLALLGRPRAAFVFFLAASATATASVNLTPATNPKLPVPPSPNLPSTCTRTPGFGPPVALSTWPPAHLCGRTWPADYTPPYTWFNGAGGGTTQLLPNASTDPLLAYYYARYYDGASPETDVYSTPAPEGMPPPPAVHTPDLDPGPALEVNYLNLIINDSNVTPHFECIAPTANTSGSDPCAQLTKATNSDTGINSNLIKISAHYTECTAPVVHVTDPGWQTKFWYKAMRHPQHRSAVQEFDDP